MVTGVPLEELLVRERQRLDRVQFRARCNLARRRVLCQSASKKDKRRRAEDEAVTDPPGAPPSESGLPVFGSHGILGSVKRH